MVEHFPVEMVIIKCYSTVQAKCLRHSLEQAARGIVFYMNSDKPEFMF